MNVKKTIATTASAAILGVGAFALAGVATAASGHPQVDSAAASVGASTSPSAKVAARHPRLRLMLRRGVVRISAKTIGITPQALRIQLKAGQSIADVAAAHHVDPNAVVTAIVNAGEARIDKAVGNSKLTSAQGAALKGRLPQLAQKVVDHHRPQAGASLTPSNPTSPSTTSGTN